MSDVGALTGAPTGASTRASTGASADPGPEPAAPLRRRRARRGEGERLREEVLAAARDLLAETGSEDAVSIRAVAQRVGVTTPSIYLHFADKTALLDAVCEQVFSALDQRMEAAAADAGHPLEALRRSGMAYIEFGLANPEHYRLVFMTRRASGEALAEEIADCAFQHVTARVQACIDEGILHGDPTELAIVLWTSVHGLTSLLIAKPDWTWPPVEQLADLVVRSAGLGIVALQHLGRHEPEDAVAALEALRR